jgi:uncharacterized protein
MIESADLPTEPQRGRPWGAWATAGFGALCLIVWMVTQTIFFSLLEAAHRAGMPIPGLAEDAPLSDFAYNGFALSVVTIGALPALLGCCLLFAALRRGASIRDQLGLNPAAWKTCLIWCGATLALILVFDGAKYILNYDIMPEFVLRIMQNPGSYTLLFIALVIAAPLGEEVLFRGFLFPGLAASPLRAAGAILAPAAVWALIHLQYEWIDILYAFVIGILLGVARLRTNSLYVPIVMHAFNNALSFFSTLYFLRYGA